MKGTTILDIIIFLFATLFLYAAVTKLTDYQTFQAQLGKSPLIMGHAEWLAFMVPTLEIAVAVTLLIYRLQVIALYASFTIMFLFTEYIAFILLFSPYVPCSCGGILSKMGWTEHLLFNTAFTLLAILGIHLRLKQEHAAETTLAL
jgi:uncharacterized membrane protein YphA (DoxX/SURF4 family)